MLRRTRFLFFFIVASVALASHIAAQQATIDQLKAKLEKQYETIYEVFANSPGKRTFPEDPRLRIRQWQDELSRSFAEAQATIEEIIKLHPSDEEFWRERRDTMRLYAQPVSPPETREVFGKNEVAKQARIIDAPAAEYLNAARAAKAKGEVRLRLVLASDGSVKYVFPMKPLKYWLTEAAMDAARRITFEPALRDGKPVSQFLTLSYEFRNGRGLVPYVPKPEFYF